MKDLGKKYDRLDPHVRELVRVLNTMGVSTVWSSDGDLAEIPYPYVDIDVEDCGPGALEALELGLAKANREYIRDEAGWMLDAPRQASRGDQAVLVRRLRPKISNTEGNRVILEALQLIAGILREALERGRS